MGGSAIAAAEGICAGEPAWMKIAAADHGEATANAAGIGAAPRNRAVTIG